MSAASSESRSAELPGLRVTDVCYAPRFTTPPHEHEHDCVTIALAGTFTKELDRRERALPVGAVAVTPAGSPHVDRFGADGGRALVVEVAGSGGARLRGARVPESLRLGWLGRRLAFELQATDEAAPLALHGAALELLALLTRAQARPATRAPRWFDEVTDYLHDHALERVTLEELSTLAGVHKTHLARVFRARHGLSVGAYHRRLRIQWAADALLRSDTPLARVAACAGFADQSHFTRTFVGHFGVPPGRWRSERRPRG